MRILASLSLALFTAGLGGCSFGVGVDAEPGFACTTNDDCVSGYFCLGAEALPDGEFGRCVSESAAPTTCVDSDNDGFYASGCATVTPEQYDCNDADREINPGAEEICDGIDNNCNCGTDSNADGTVCGINDDGVDEDLPVRNCSLQAGVCAGATIECINGQYPTARCGDFGAYPETYENAAVETICDGLDNNCNAQIDEGNCDCQLDNTAALECGRDTGECSRGIKVCGEDATRSECLAAFNPRVCEDGTDCSDSGDCSDGSDCAQQICDADEDCTLYPNGFCVQELVNVVESIDDSCDANSPSRDCPQTVCRYLEGVDECAANEDCPETESCVGGFCQVGVIAPLASDPCNGLDDNCDGLIDSPSRTTSCGQCPYNSLLTNLATAVNGSTFYCVDRYEASRPDASGADAGNFELYAASQAGVVPWTGISPDDALIACQGSEYATAVGLPSGSPAVAIKALCISSVWAQGCGGITGRERLYPYVEGITEDNFQAGACVDSNRGVDGPQLTGASPECCYAPNPTFPEATTCDMVGNVAEWVTVPGRTALAGGSYEDSDPGILSCGNGISYQTAPDVESFDGIDTIGFRCCTRPLR
jgi:hypothetical protein